MTRSLIYALVDPLTEQVRYIGRSINGLTRARIHRAPAKLRIDRTHKANWIRSLMAQGLTYQIRVMEECDPSAIDDAERRWIAAGRAMGWPLTNLTDGGDGALGHRHTDATKAKIRSIVNRPDEHRKRISSTLRGHVISTEVRARIAEGMRRAHARRKELTARSL